MATIYHPAEKDYFRKAGDTSGFGVYAPAAIPLTGKTVKFQLREIGSDRIIYTKLSTTVGQITVTDQHIEVAITNTDTALLDGVYAYDLEIYSADKSYVQTLQTGKVTYKREYSHE